MMHLQEEEVVLVQAVMLHHAVPEMVEFSLDKEELDSKPGNSYITSLVELSRAARDEKTLSDGPDPESDYAPARLSPAPTPARLSPAPAPGSEADSLGERLKRTVELMGLEERKLSGEPELCSPALSQPAILVLCVFLACLHSATGLDIMSAAGILVTLVTLVSLLLQ